MKEPTTNVPVFAVEIAERYDLDNSGNYRSIKGYEKLLAEGSWESDGDPDDNIWLLYPKNAETVQPLREKLLQDRRIVAAGVVDDDEYVWFKADHLCKFCGAIDGETGAIGRDGKWRDEHSLHHMNSTEGYMLFPDGFPHCPRVHLRSGYCQHCWPAAFPEKHAEQQRKAALRKLVRDAKKSGQAMMWEM